MQTLFFGYTYLDDNNLILDNQSFITDITNVPQAFKEDVFHTPGGRFYYRPLMTLSLMADAQISGIKPFMYHLTNVIIHLTTMCLMYLLLTKFRFTRTMSLFWVLVYTVHPVFSQAVSWVPGRNNSLLTLFTLSSFIFFIDFITTKKFNAFMWHVLFLIFALFTKETAIVIPAVCFCYVFFIAKKEFTLKNLFGPCFIWLIVLGTWIFIRSSVLNNPASLSFSVIKRSLVDNYAAIIVYIGKIFYPANLCVYPVLQDVSLMIGLTAMTGFCTAIFLLARKSINWVLFGTAWFFAFLLPSLVKPNISIIPDFLDHRVYESFPGFLFIFSVLDFGKLNKKMLSVTGLIIISVLLWTTFSHSKNFKNRLVFWQNAVSGSPHSAFAHNNLGAMYFLDNKHDMAEQQWKQAIALNPKERLVHGNLGLIYMNTGRLTLAEPEYLQEIEINPDYDHVYFNLGLLYYQQKKIAQAAEMWKKTLQKNPGYVGAYVNLIYYYYSIRDMERINYYMAEANRNNVQLPIKQNQQ
jgi:tetratricopeptide (TPR) repeat protein